MSETEDADPDILRFIAGCVVGMTAEGAPAELIERARRSYIQECIGFGLSEADAKARLQEIEAAAAENAGKRSLKG